jgi:chromosome segregation ATPase
MNELVIEKLIQKVNTAIEELMNLNLLVRSLPPSVEIMNLLNTRIDAIQASIVQIERKISSDNQSIKQLQSQYPGILSAVEEMKDKVSSFQKSLSSYEGLLDKTLRNQEQLGKFLESEVSSIKVHEFESRTISIVTIVIVIIIAIRVFCL